MAANLQQPIIHPPICNTEGCCLIVKITTGWLLGTITHWDNREHIPSLGFGHYLLTYEVLSVIGHYFHSYFLSIFNPTSITFLTPSFPLMLIFFMFLFLCLIHAHKQMTRTHPLVQLVTDNLIYLATDILKQSHSSSPTQSCAGTLSATLACSHNSKFQTSRTQSMSRSASTTQSPLLIARFLVSTAARTS